MIERQTTEEEMFVTMTPADAVPNTILGYGDILQFTTASTFASQFKSGDRVLTDGFAEHGFADGECRFGASANFGNGTSVVSFIRITEADREISQRLGI
jgi:hypothetical protein